MILIIKRFKQLKKLNLENKNGTIRRSYHTTKFVQEISKREAKKET